MVMTCQVKILLFRSVCSFLFINVNQFGFLRTVCIPHSIIMSADYSIHREDEKVGWEDKIKMLLMMNKFKYYCTRGGDYHFGKSRTFINTTARCFVDDDVGIIMQVKMVVSLNLSCFSTRHYHEASFKRHNKKW